MSALAVMLDWIRPTAFSFQPVLLRLGQHAAVAHGARANSQQANGIHQSVGRTRYHGDFALGFQRDQKIDCFQAAAGNQLRVGLGGSREHLRAEIV